jgi:predicted metal-dependent hydrolase
VQYGHEEIRYEVITRPKRRTLGIEVHPDGKVLVLAPSGCAETTIEEKIRHRARWISRQLKTFKSYEPRTTPRQYLAGESHRYLGRQYRLRLVISAEVPKPIVKLIRGELIISGQGKLSRVKIRELLRGWYLERARG